jgi:hypothetical protein
MSFFPALTDRLSTGLAGLQRIASRSRAELTGQSTGAFDRLSRVGGRVGPIAARARAAVAGDGTPNIGNDASEAAVSVADAAKRLMLEQLDHDSVDLVVIREVAHRAVVEASEAGADVTAAAVGATMGAVQAARAEGLDVEGPGRAAAAGAFAAATELGDVAAQRVRDAIQRRERGLNLIEARDGAPAFHLSQ